MTAFKLNLATFSHASPAAADLCALCHGDHPALLALDYRLDLDSARTG